MTTVLGIVLGLAVCGIWAWRGWSDRTLLALGLVLFVAGSLLSSSCRHVPDGDDTITIRVHGCGWAK